MIILLQLKPETMKTTKIEETRNSDKGNSEQKFALLTNDDHLIDLSINEVKLERMQVNLINTKEISHKSQTSSLWFNEWIVGGGEKKRIEACQSEAKNKKYDQLSVPPFLF